MKKILVVFAFAGVFASCNNAGDAEQSVKDSLDSIEKLKIESIDEAAEKAKDTIQESTEQLKEKVDSIGETVRDTMNNSN